MPSALLGEELGQGGEGTVYALPNASKFIGNFAMHVGELVGRGPWVYKHYTGAFDWNRLVTLVEWFAHLPRGKENTLLDSTTWPQVVVSETRTADWTPGPGAVGIVMPRLRDDYFMTLSSLGRTTRKYRVIDYLTWNQMQAGQVEGFEFPRLRQRLGILHAVSSTLGVLHENGLHYGDINPTNIVMGPDWDNPRICLVDCDSIRTGRSTDGAPVNAPGWEPPEGGVDQRTDCYKFALLALRSLGCSSDTAALIAALRHRELGLSPEFGQLLLAGLNPDPRHRPSIQAMTVGLAAEAEHTPPAKMPWSLPIPMEHRRTASGETMEPAEPPAPQPAAATAAYTPTYTPAAPPTPTPTPAAKKASSIVAASVTGRSRNRLVIAAAIVAGIAVIGGIVYALTSGSDAKPGSDNTAATSTVPAQPVATTTAEPAGTPTTAKPAGGPGTVRLTACQAAFQAYRTAPIEERRFPTIVQCKTEAEWNAANTGPGIGESLDHLCARRMNLSAPACSDSDKRRSGH